MSDPRPPSDSAGTNRQSENRAEDTANQTSGSLAEAGASRGNTRAQGELEKQEMEELLGTEGMQREADGQESGVTGVDPVTRG